MRLEVGYADLDSRLDDFKKYVPGTAGQFTVGYSICFGDYKFRSMFLSASFQNISTVAGTVSYPTIQFGLGM